jgi:hypothetical protein
VDDLLKSALRAHIETHGVPAIIDHDAEWPEDEVSEYGWVDYQPLVHASDPSKVHKGEGCRWVIPVGAQVTQRTYTLYDGPGREKTEAGFNTRTASCACGKNTSVTLRVTQPLGEVLLALTVPAGDLTL